jgi:hypothetical protein
MQWLLHGSLSSAVGEALRRRGDRTHERIEAVLPDGAPPLDVLRAAQSRQWDVVSNDPALVRAPYEAGFAFGRCIVFLQLKGDDVEQDDAIERLFARYPSPKPGRLYTVTSNRVKVRQLPRPAA